MNRRFLRCWPLLAGVFGILPAAAQLQQASERTSAPHPVPCLRAYCGVVAAIAEPAPAGGVLALPVQQQWQRAGASEWDQHMGRQRPAESYQCLLSAAVGGELTVGGYRGVALFGQTRTLRRAGTGAAQ